MTSKDIDLSDDLKQQLLSLYATILQKRLMNIQHSGSPIESCSYLFDKHESKDCAFCCLNAEHLNRHKLGIPSKPTTCLFKLTYVVENYLLTERSDENATNEQ